MPEKKKKALAAAAMAAGVCLLLYPWISNAVYERSTGSAVETYEKTMEETTDAALEELLAEARAYNDWLRASGVMLTDPFVAAAEGTLDDPDYEGTLALNSAGLMCFIEIPAIGVYLPVYHGTSDEVLEKGAGHVEGSSLPVGGEGTHAVISAHTGLSTAKMFSDLPDLEEGDLFFIHILDETLAYRVAETDIILPEETETLAIRDGEDLVSLLTCYPYGANTHRYVVTGERTDYTEEVRAEAEAQDDGGPSVWMQQYRRALLTGLAIAGGITAAVMAGRKREERKLKRAYRKGGM